MALILATSRAFPLYPEVKQLLEQAGHQVRMPKPKRPYSAQELFPLMAGVEAVMAGIDDFNHDVINCAAPHLKIIARSGIGYNKIDLVAAKQNNVLVTATPGKNSIAVAELTLLFMLGLARHLHTIDGNVRQGSWQSILGNELYGKTVGIIGTGHVGSKVAKRCRAFDMQVLAYDLQPSEELIRQYQVTYTRDLDALLAHCDYISLHIPSTPLTRDLFNRDKLNLLKPGAFFINTARGDLVDEAALYDALASKRIAGAGIDVFRQEPFFDPRFFALPNVLFTPHSGAYTQESSQRTLTAAAEEIIRVLAGAPPLHPVLVE